MKKSPQRQRLEASYSRLLVAGDARQDRRPTGWRTVVRALAAAFLGAVATTLVFQ